MGRRPEAPDKLQERLSVVLEAELAEHVRVRAFEERKSKSAFLRTLVLADARKHPRSAADVLAQLAVK